MRVWLVWLALAACKPRPPASMPGHVVCWGLGRSGQIGDGKSTESNAPAAVSGVDDATAIFAGSSASCARRASTLACWGKVVAGVESAVPAPVPFAANAVEIAVGGLFACARRVDGSVVCSGSNLVGELGNGGAPDAKTKVAIRLEDADKLRTPPSQTGVVTGLADAVGLGAGTSHACAARKDGTVVCWGSDQHGELGDGKSGYSMRSDRPVGVAGVRGAVQLAAGAHYTCARISDGSVWCWGMLSEEFPRTGKPVVRPTPHAIADISGASSIAIEDQDRACAVVAGGAVRCWGPDEIAGKPLFTGAAQLSAGMRFSCARLRDGHVTCFGENWSGSLGWLDDNDYTDHPAYAPIRTVDHVVSVAAGSRHACVLRSDIGH